MMHITCMKFVQFSRSPTPPVHLRPKFFYPLDLEGPISNKHSSVLQVITNLKKDIMQEWLLDVIRSFLQVGFRFQYQLINLVWLSFPLSGFPFDFLSPCMWTNEIKIKTKQSLIIFKLTTRSIVRFIPQTIQWYH